MLCGGIGFNIDSHRAHKDCHLLSKNGIWLDLPSSMGMREKRTEAAAVHFDGVWWVTGKNILYFVALSNTPSCDQPLGFGCHTTHSEGLRKRRIICSKAPFFFIIQTPLTIR